MTATIFSGEPTITQHLVPVASLNTLEKILLWCLLLFHRLNKSKDLFLIDDGQVKQCAYQRFEGKDGTLYLGFTTFVPVSADYEVLPNKPWTYAIELNNAVASNNYNS